jgi:hypothetical protein
MCEKTFPAFLCLSQRKITHSFAFTCILDYLSSLPPLKITIRWIALSTFHTTDPRLLARILKEVFNFRDDITSGGFEKMSLSKTFNFSLLNSVGGLLYCLVSGIGNSNTLDTNAYSKTAGIPRFVPPCSLTHI